MKPPSLSRRAFAAQFLQLAAALAAPRWAQAAVVPPAGTALHNTLLNEPGARVRIHRDVLVRMRDGVELATDVYLPAAQNPGAATPASAARVSGSWPVILERTPYGKSGNTLRHASRELALQTAQLGYAVVYQDCRGRGGSGGDYVKYLSDGDDGYDCCAWLLQQPWCDGRIGVQGLSYGAHTATALACAGAPGVAALFLDSGGFANAFQGGIRQGGAFEMKQVTWAFKAAQEAPEIKNDPALAAAFKAIDLHEWFGKLPWKRGHSPLSLAPEYEDYVFDQWEAGRFDGFWKQLGIYAEGFRGTFSDVPTWWMSSWYDPYPRSTVDNYSALRRLKRAPQHLLLGPWTHGNNHETFAGDADFGSAATLAGAGAFAGAADLAGAAGAGAVAAGAATLPELRRRFFAHYLPVKPPVAVPDRPVATPGMPVAEPAVRYFLMGGGTGRRNAAGRMDHGGMWCSAAVWPLPSMREQRYFLHRGAGEPPLPAGGASVAPQCLLSLQKPARGVEPLSFRYDPRMPVPSIGGTITSGQPIMVGGAFDQREGADFFGSTVPGRATADRPDVLAFTTPVLEHDLVIAGPVEAVLWVSTDCPDTDFTVKLVDVYPPNEDYPQGYAMNLTDGILRCRYRRSWERPQPLRPGEVVRLKIVAFPTANRFCAGHRLRLEVASSNFPHFDLNPNTGEAEGAWTTTRVATNTVYLDAARPSYLKLPVTG